VAGGKTLGTLNKKWANRGQGKKTAPPPLKKPGGTATRRDFKLGGGRGTNWIKSATKTRPAFET